MLVTLLSRVLAALVNPIVVPELGLAVGLLFSVCDEAVVPLSAAPKLPRRPDEVAPLVLLPFPFCRRITFGK